MRTATLRLEDMKTTIINMGYVGENEHKQIRFDGKKMFQEYPNASVSLTVCPACGEAYPATIERDGDFVLWTITDSDLVAEGCGEIQLTFTESPHIAKSYICRTKVLRSLVPTGDIPSGLDDFITRADALLEELEDAIPEGGTTGQVLAKKSNDDFDTEWVDQTGGGGTGDYTDLTNKPQIGGVTLTGNKTLHDLGAATEEAVGAKYTKPSGGIPASDMASGVIPVLTDLIDDTAGDGDTDKVWSADKSADTVQSVLSDLSVLEPTASASDVGKFLKAKTVSNGRVTEYEFGEGGGGISNDLKTALLSLAENAAYSTNQGQNVYNALVGALYTKWPVTNTLTHCTTSNSATDVTKNAGYSATITADTDYTLTGATVTITMGGTDITSTAYSNGTISIASVTGLLSISITAASASTSYVTDGLVAYWDGIDNTGNGHDSTATTWKDLVGNYDLTQSTVGGTWTTNALEFNKTAYNGYYGDTLWTFSQYATIEIVTAPDRNDSTMMVGIFDRGSTEMSTSQYDTRRFVVYSDGTIGFFGRSAYTYSNPTESLTSIRKLVAVYNNFDVTKAFVNNIQASVGNKTHNFGFTGNAQIRLGSNAFDTSSYSYGGIIYAIRVYNRALTDAEITQNFNYDNQRFSLGVT